MRAGNLSRRVIVQRRVAGQDAGGQPLDSWVNVGKLWTNPKNETGLAVIRGQREAGVPSSVARYSFEARRDAVLALGVDVGMRVVHAGMNFDIKVLIQDLNSREGMFLVCEQGGSNG